MDQAVLISDLLKAVSYKTTYLEDIVVNNLYQRLIEAAEVFDYPVAPVLPTLTVPSGGTTIIVQGTQGPAGQDGGGTDFSSLGVATDTVVDSFPLTSAYGARWDVLVNGTAQRAGTVWATWTEDGLAVDFSELGTPDVNGSTAGITFTVTIFGGNVRLNAIVTSGTWNVVGSRYFIPNNGVGVVVNTGSSLPDGQVFIGDVSNLAQPQTLSGDVSMTNTGVVSITPLVITNGDINAAAAITFNKMAALTASRALVSDGAGVVGVSAVTSTELGYLSGVTSNIQTQLDSKVGSITGAISTVVAVDLTASRAVVSNPAGKIAISGTTSTELGYLSGVTSAVQTQIDSKQATITGGATTITSSNLTASRALASDGSGKVAVSSVTATELGYVSGVTSAIQTQLDNKMPDEVGINDQTGTTYTLALSDKNSSVRMANALTNTLTVPANASVAFPVGSQVIIVRAGDGDTRIAPDTGVTINTIGLQVVNPNYVTISQKYRGATLVKVATNEWDLFGTLQ
jgi:hypothetical protein